MNQRYQSEEISRVSEQYAENELYKAVCTIGQQLESETVFGLCPEECFTETLELLTAIAGKGEEILTVIDEYWLRKFNEYRRFDRHVNEDEIRKAVGIVFGFTILSIDSSRHSFYRYTLTRRLMQIIADNKFPGWQSTLDRIFSVPLSDGWFDDFIDEEPEDGEGRLPLPKVLNTDRAQTYFQKAIDKRYMKLENGLFSWIGVGGKGINSQLAYFCGRVFEYRHSTTCNIGTEFPEEELNALFGVKRLYSLLTQVHNAQKTQKWRRIIDEMFE